MSFSHKVTTLSAAKQQLEAELWVTNYAWYVQEVADKPHSSSIESGRGHEHSNGCLRVFAKMLAAGRICRCLCRSSGSAYSLASFWSRLRLFGGSTVYVIVDGHVTTHANRDMRRCSDITLRTVHNVELTHLPVSALLVAGDYEDIYSSGHLIED